MDLDIKQHLPEDFAYTSKVWIFQSSRLFLISESLDMEEMLTDFAKQWKSHGIPVKGFAMLFFGRFVVLMADETATGVSGCSTDSSVHVIKNIEKKFNVHMFHRESLAFVVKDKIELIPLPQLQYAIQNMFINRNTLYFNNIITSKAELISNWIIPAGDTWLAKYFDTAPIPDSLS